MRWSAAVRAGCTILALAAAIPVAQLHAQYTNVALGRDVTGVGTFGTLRPVAIFGPQPLAAFSTLTDGVVLPNGTPWQDGVWWDRGGAIGATDPALLDTRVEIDLGSMRSLTGYALSFDNNDVYSVFTRNNVADSWELWSSIFCSAGCAAGVLYDGIPGLFEATPRDARYVAVTGFGGDGYYALTEVELYALAAEVPEPAALALLATGLAGLALARRRRRTT